MVREPTHILYAGPITIVVPGVPLARKAHKLIRLPNGRPKPVLTDDAAAFQNLCAMAAQRAMGTLPPVSEIAWVDFLWVFPPPMSRMKKAQRLLLESGDLLFYDGRADTDNLMKNTLDGIKEIAIADDSLACSGVYHKRWGVKPCTVVEIWDMDYPHDARPCGSTVDELWSRVQRSLTISS